LAKINQKQKRRKINEPEAKFSLGTENQPESQKGSHGFMAF